MSRLAPTIKDVAALSAVSIKTVSRVVNNEPGVRPDTAARVRAAADELGYAVNQAARRLAGGRTGTLGMLIYAATSWHWTADLVAGAVARAHARGYGLIPYILENYDEDQRATVLWLAAQQAVDGVILTPPWAEFPLLHQELAERGMPLALVPAPRHAAGLTVRSDEATGIRELMTHLLAQGHRRFGVIGGQIELDSVRIRMKAVRASLREAGLDPEIPAMLRDWYFATGYDGGRMLLAAPDRPTALVCFSDVLAAGALRAAHEARLSVPGDVSIAGIGDQDIAEMVWPSLTTVHIPSQDMAGSAVDLLVDQIQGAARAPRSSIFPTQLVIRGSTGPAPT